MEGGLFLEVDWDDFSGRLVEEEGIGTSGLGIGSGGLECVSSGSGADAGY